VFINSKVILTIVSRGGGGTGNTGIGVAVGMVDSWEELDSSVGIVLISVVIPVNLNLGLSSTTSSRFI